MMKFIIIDTVHIMRTSNKEVKKWNDFWSKIMQEKEDTGRMCQVLQWNERFKHRKINDKKKKLQTFWDINEEKWVNCKYWVQCNCNCWFLQLLILYYNTKNKTEINTRTHVQLAGLVKEQKSLKIKGWGTRCHGRIMLVWNGKGMFCPCCLHWRVLPPRVACWSTQALKKEGCQYRERKRNKVTRGLASRQAGAAPYNIILTK